MESDFDLDKFGKRLRGVRSERGLTLKEVSEATKISIATLSRIELGEAKGLEGRALITLANWANLPLALFESGPSVAPSKGYPKAVSTPDAVELHLRADKNLKPRTAELLAKMFRAAYTEAASQKKD
jgi:transcriptional regulator with XRE-family HTH domain